MAQLDHQGHCSVFRVARVDWTGLTGLVLVPSPSVRPKLHNTLTVTLSLSAGNIHWLAQLD